MYTGRMSTLPVRNRLGYGAMQLAGRHVFGPPRDRDEALRVLRRAVELGVDHVDTSQYYGPNVVNELLREALYPYDGLRLVSKVGARRDATGAWLPWDRPADLRQGIEDNLRSLGVAQLAAVNLRVMETLDDDQVGAMVQAREDGLIAGVGVSNVTHDQLLQVLAITDVVCVQNPYNLVDRSSKAVLEECIARDISFVPFFPLGSGFGVDDVRGLPALHAVAQRLGATPSQVALAWLLDLDPCVLLIPGTSSLSHLEENVAAAEVVLDDEARNQLARP